ncbi:MAG: thermonuclease family protein [Chitinivibrionia bacterium]|nr:thermonuclease family protein [Chitinivibrionia bacterium]
MKRIRRIRNLAALVALLGAAVYVTCADEDPPGYKPSYRGAHYVRTERVRFDDGDTFTYENTEIRILGIDCPEIRHPDVGMHEDQPYGRAAAESTYALVMRAGTVEYVLDGDDYYGRKLGHIFVDGELLSVRLLERGLAYETVTHYGDNGFPDLAQRILDASLKAPKPLFEKPSQWRRKHQKK